MSTLDLHIFFLPFLTPGHMIPMVDLAKIFATRGVKVTIVTTTANASLIQPTIDRCPHYIQLLTLHLPSSVENLMGFPSPTLTPEFIRAINSLKEPFRNLLNEHQPDFIVSDVFYPWTSDLGITRLTFHGSSAFGSVVAGTIGALKLHETVSDLNEPLIVPGMPHHIEMTKSKLMVGITNPDELTIQMVESFQRSYGIIMNTVCELESEYVTMMNRKVWIVGPVSLCNQGLTERAVRGGSGEDFIPCLNWLDNQTPGSVLYACFGSLGRFTCSQLHEIAVGLEASGHPFIWVTKSVGDDVGDNVGWISERLKEKGLITTRWVPQILILNHEAVGGFMTHCGWNSCLEGASAGLPMITWPLFAEQFFNEKLLVDVLRIGVPVGAKICSNDAEKRTLVKSEEVENAVKMLMGSGKEADERRKRAKKVAEMAKKAVEEGGSSYDEMTRLIQELMEVKAGKVEGRENLV